MSAELILEVRNLYKHFHMRQSLLNIIRRRSQEVVRAVDGVDLEIAAGEFFSLLGASGCGKTTLLRLMAGLVAPSAGRVRFAGRDVTGVPVQQRRVSMVYQQFINYPNLSVFDNIASPLKVAGVSAVASAARLARFRTSSATTVKPVPAAPSTAPRFFITCSASLAMLSVTRSARRACSSNPRSASWPSPRWACSSWAWC